MAKKVVLVVKLVPEAEEETAETIEKQIREEARIPWSAGIESVVLVPY